MISPGVTRTAIRHTKTTYRTWHLPRASSDLTEFCDPTHLNKTIALPTGYERKTLRAANFTSSSHTTKVIGLNWHVTAPHSVFTTFRGAFYWWKQFRGGFGTRADGGRARNRRAAFPWLDANVCQTYSRTRTTLGSVKTRLVPAPAGA